VASNQSTAVKAPKQQQQQGPKQGTLQALWGATTAAVRSVMSPAKARGASQSGEQPDTQQQQEQQQGSQGCSAAAVKGMPADEEQQQQQKQKQKQQGSPGQEQADVEQLRGPWDPQGFAYRKLDSKLTARVFNDTGDARRQLQALMMSQEPAGGHVSLDHVHETAKRQQGGFIGTLIAMGASGLVLGFWNVFSTSLHDIETQLRDLDQRQRRQHGQVG
jgi:hypothetical protein